MNELKTDQFVRFRLGVGRGKEDIKRSTDRNIHRRKIEKFVLEPFSEKEIGDSRKMIGRAVEAIEVALEKGLAVAMNRFN
jgi:peptidyl-tRNA hydrolase